MLRLPGKTTWQPAWKPFEKERFCSFPHRHGEATGKPEPRDETRGSIKTSISCETSSNFHTLWQNRCFPTSFLRNLQICYLKIDVSCEASINFHHSSQNPTPATEFAPCRHFAKPWQCDVQKTRKNTQDDTSKASRLPRTMNIDGHVQSAAPATKTGTHLLQTTQHCACHTKRLSTRYKTGLNVMKCHACHTKRSNATFETPKSDPLRRTYHRHGHNDLAPTVANGCGRLRTVADGCERLRTVADGWGRLGNVERTHTQPPDPQSEMGTLTTHSGKRSQPVTMEWPQKKTNLITSNSLHVFLESARLRTIQRRFTAGIRLTFGILERLQRKARDVGCLRMSSEMLKRSHISLQRMLVVPSKLTKDALTTCGKLEGRWGGLAPSGKILTFLSKALSGVQQKVQFWTFWLHCCGYCTHHNCTSYTRPSPMKGWRHPNASYKFRTCGIRISLLLCLA